MCCRAVLNAHPRDIRPGPQNTPHRIDIAPVNVGATREPAIACSIDAASAAGDAVDTVNTVDGGDGGDAGDGGDGGGAGCSGGQRC